MNISSEQTYQNHRAVYLQWTIALILLMLSSSLSAEEPDNSRLDLFGDLRLRMEQDWDSLNGDGTKRNDRLRLRLRLRAGLNYSFSEHWSTTIAVRSGPHLSQQSPHITLYDFDDGPDGPYEFNFDHWYLNYNDGRFEGWLGRNELSFWHQDDTFIFDNVTYPGIGGSYRYGLSDASLTWHANLVALPVGMRDFSGTGLNGQVVYEKEHDDADDC